MTESETPTLEQEQRYRHYTGNRIPWFVHLLWLCFWTFAIYYTLQYFVPTLHHELVTPP